ncbi:uncharacterized protein LACBIDRAFT_305951 [Laccaria bicolor S238N-H82]|uniref:Predicted protein n=1 Tax=Laccaria bicolor (strain S238N-H82 / ATCC MYA-4686) TaxID=486041 RepID=B0CSB9_LACBS|nr:uncharacterized protein LACBIDRAFT_305951 [Laccaria bicolor S238N-H82]EDR14818.1 predicted protein [Laccaria bicolor S238N-H82]|eukprot:XP_001875377.1 predicted protein [Laccaria bicolor S238N-H82]
MSTTLTQKWLRQNLHSYSQKDRVYSDIDAALARFQTLRPKSDIYTFDDGRTQLLLCIHGLLPISFRQASYNIPISVWLPRQYPQQPPIPYVVPTTDMLVKSGPYVDVSGKCNPEYIQHWERKYEGCSLSALFEAFQDQFSREPPVYSKPKQQPLTAYSSHNGNSYAVRTPPPLPRPAPSTSSTSSSTPPPIPTRPADLHSNSLELQTSTARPLSPPPLPPLPPVLPYNATPRAPYSNHSTLNQQSWYVPPARPPPSFLPNQTPTTQHQPNESRLSQSPPPPPPPPLLPLHFAPPMRLPESNSTPTPARNPQLPIADLLDGDADVPREGNSIQSPVPPRPLNPELLNLHTQVHAKLTSELDSLTQALALDAERLRAHQSDLLSGEPVIHDEMARLEAVRDVCRNVAFRTNGAVQQVEANISELRRKGDPEVDELICSTNIVHNQLINLIADDHSIEDTVYHLHRALNTGRIDLERFLRTTRVLAEEQFMKRALIEKILTGISTLSTPIAPWT